MKFLKASLAFLILVSSFTLAFGESYPSRSYNQYVPSQLIVKFKESAHPKLSLKVTKGILSTGISSVDLLNRKYEVKEAEQVLWKSLKSEKNKELKKEFGFDRVYLFKYSKSADVFEVASAYAQDPNVEYAQPNTVYRISAVYPDDPYFALQWSLHRIDAPYAWETETGDSTVLLCILDTGVDWDHPDLKQKVWQNLGEDFDGDGHTLEFDGSEWEFDPGDLNGTDDDDNGYDDDLIGWDFCSVTEGYAPGEDPAPRDSNPMDFQGHGTRCSGVAAGATFNSTGISGTAPDCRIMAVRAGYMGTDGSGYLQTTDWVYGLIYATDNGADVVSMSFGGSSTYPFEENVIRYADSLGVLLVAAAGNDGQKNYSQYPAYHPQVMCIAATDQSDHKTTFSNYGDSVDVSAPGTNITTTSFDDDYRFTSWGTSYSTPRTAALAALLISHFPDSSNLWIRQRIVESADDIDFLNPSYAGWLGSGRINAYKALNWDAPTPILKFERKFTDDAGGNEDGLPNPGETVELVVKLENNWTSATGISGILSTSDSYLNITDNSAVFENIPGGATGDNLADPFVVDISGGCPAEHLAEMVLDLTASGGYATTIRFDLLVYGDFAFCDVSEQKGVDDFWGSRGASWGDFNQDGFLDLYLANVGANRLFINNNGDLFEEEAFSYGVDNPATGISSAWGDYDNDSDLDLYLNNWYTTYESNLLFQNDLSFFDQTNLMKHQGNGYGVAWADFDNDGDLDLYVANYGEENILYYNKLIPTGNLTFGQCCSEVSDPGSGKGVGWADFDNDGDLDLYLVNENQANRLYRNNLIPSGEKNFTEISSSAGVDDSGPGSGCAWGDFDNDGDLDLYLSKDGPSNILYRNDIIPSGDTTFTQCFPEVSDPNGGEQVLWGDFDNDGYLDLFVVNYDQKNRLYLNNQGISFSERAESLGLADSGYGQGAAWGDYDNDGDLDLYLCNRFQPNKLYENRANTGHWLIINARGRISNSFGIGARVKLVAGGTVQIREVGCGNGYYSQNPLPVHFGLGESESVDSILLSWPSGYSQDTTNLNADNILNIFEKFPRGDVNQDTSINLSDVIYIANYYLKGGPEPQPLIEMGDVNCDGQINLSDVIHLANYYLKGGEPPGFC